MKTQYYTAASLDGFIATEDDSLDWLFPLGDIKDTGYPAFIAGVGALAMGSATYEWMLRHAQTVASETGSAWPYEQPAWVFTSRTLPSVPGARLSFAQGDVRPVHAAMRAAAGGRGKPLFPRRLTTLALELVSARQIGAGFAELRYRLPARRASLPA